MFGRAATGTRSWARHDDPLTRQMIWEWIADRLAARVGRNERGRAASLGGGHLGSDLVFGGGGFEVFELKFHLIKELAAAFRAAAIKLPPHLLDSELEMRDQCFGARDIGHRTRSCGLGTGSLRLRVNARGALHGQEPFEAFQIVRQFVNRRRHACDWSTGSRDS
jgi:hypothetical protein